MPPIIGRSTEGRDVRINVEKLVETRLLVTANSGAGKSFTLRRLLEQTHGMVQQIVIDVEDEFGTLREKYDYVLAGRMEGGECAANPGCADLLARKLLELRCSTVIGIYELRADQRISFVKLFLESLIDSPKSLWHPAMIVIDETHIFGPESTKCESKQAVIDLATRGRKRGFCLVAATQRPSMLDKNISAQCNNKLVGRFSQDIDVKRAAEDLGFYRREQQAELRSLKPGQFFAVGPALCEEVTQITVGPVATSHPRAGQRIMAPPPPREAIQKILASLADLPKEAERELQTVQELRAEVRKLQTEARKAKPEAELRAMEQRHAEEMRRVRTAAKRACEMLAGVPQAIEATREFIAPIAGDDNLTSTPLLSSGGSLTSDSFNTKFAKPSATLTLRAESNGHKREASAAKPDGEAKILRALAELAAIGVTAPPRLQVVFMSGYTHPNSSPFASGIKSATEKGFIQIGHGTISITPEGRAMVDNIKPPKSSDELQQRIIGMVGGASGKILRELLDEYPNAIDRAALVARSGYGHPNSSPFAQAMGRLSAFGFIETTRGQVKATRLLFLEGR